MAVEIRAAGDGDRHDIEALLSAAGLPLDGLDAAMDAALVARDGERPIGCAAVEIYGTAGLLRSVCVAPDLRGTGLGGQLVERAEMEARRRGVAEMFLLTETAIDWFPRFGYLPDSRAAAPAAIQASAEFTGACPDNARLLRKKL